MKVILRKSVPRLGSAGEIAEVADGYARNYLIPRELAYRATKGNVKRAQFEAKKVVQEAEKRLEEDKQLAQTLEGLSVTVAAHAGEEGKLFGSVSAQNIADALTEQGYPVERRQVELDAPLKELGVFPVTVRLAQDVETEVRVWVVKDCRGGEIDQKGGQDRCCRG